MNETTLPKWGKAKALEELQQRVSELSTLLNNTGKDRDLAVENERDACERAIQFLVDIRKELIKNDQLDYEAGHNTTHLAGLESALAAIQTRKNSGVRWISEMAQGTVLGEFVDTMVKEALENDRREKESTS